MRRKEKEITDTKIIGDILASAEVCRLAMVDDGEPYIVPLNYGYRDNALYVHSAPEGRKIDILKRGGKVCFEVESASAIVRHAEPCHWGAKARSLIGYGSVEIITDLEEKKRGLDVIMAHYGKAGPNAYDEKQLRAVVILRISIESVTCKQLGDWSQEKERRTVRPTR
jgi:nitroimidazol reductase NimA-like FMN-containing flavoprotein (pyridoxamine 5'-phosphate oxidase superfamily)